MHRLILLVVALAPWFGVVGISAEEFISGKSIGARYFNFDTYCDSGKRGWRDDPGRPFTQEMFFERCAHRDGRFKYVHRQESDYSNEVLAKWSDTKTYYFYLKRDSTTYWESSLDDPKLLDLYRDRSQIFPMFIFELFSRESLRNGRELVHYVESYAVSPALSSPQYSVLERSETHPVSKRVTHERLWVLNADGSIRKYEQLRDGGVLRFVEINSLEVNRPLVEADIWYSAPLLARYSMSSHPTAFVSGLTVMAAFVGGLFWGWQFAQAAMVEEVLRKRRRLWRLQLKWVGWAAIVLIVLAVLSLPGGGHPPPIFVVYVLGMWSAIAFGMTACFMLASYPLEWLFRILESRKRTGHGS